MNHGLNIPGKRDYCITFNDKFMKKKWFNDRACDALVKWLRMMKLTFLILLVTFMHLSASVYSQQTKLSLSLRNVSIRDALKQIEDQSDFFFMYKGEEINVSQNVNLQLENRTIEEILDNLFKGTHISYEIINRQIVLTNNELNGNLRITTQQQRTVKGKVTNSNGEPIPGATIVVKGTNNGTITDLDGNYTVMNVPADATLVFSFVGMKTQEIPVTGKTTLYVAMEEETIGLEEVVAIGYGTVKKSNLTGSVSTVTSEILQNRPVTDGMEALAGHIAGVQIQQISGMPGTDGLAIRVRGTGSITQSNEPLYVVDGYPMEESAFRLINSSNIERIEILKDASSTAIYGSRGSNGVVMITTKKGKGKPTLNFNMYTGFQQPAKYFDMMNRDQYIDYFIDGRNQAWLDAALVTDDPNKSAHSIDDPNSRRKLYPSASTQYLIPDGEDGYLYNFLDPESVAQMPDNDWQKLLFRNALIQNYDLSFSGGDEKTQYLFSASYLKQDGIVINTDYEKINLNANVSSQIGNRFNIGGNINTFFTTSHEQEEGKYSPIQIALQLPPIFPVKNEDGTYGSMVRNYDIFSGDVANPIGMAKQPYNYRKRNGWMATLFLELAILPELKYRISANGGIHENNFISYLPSYVDMDASRAPRVAESTNSKAKDTDWVVEQTLTFQKTLSGKHDLSVLAGYTTQKHYYDVLEGEARGFANDLIYTLNAGSMYDLSSSESEYSMISYLARINYSFDNKYLFSGAIRGDGSSRFGKDNRWGIFPSFSAGWRMKQENFMQNIQFINDLKIRASYGIVGNNRIGNYSSTGLLDVGYYPTGDALQTSVDPNTMSNNDLGWEKTEQIDLGLDLSLFENRIRLEVDYYNSKSKELLLNVPVPSITGYVEQMQNVGKVRNKGMEFLLSTKNTVNQFKWSSDFNISFNKNEVLELGPDKRPIYASAPNASNSFITTIGHPVASYYGYVYDGVFMSQEELDKYPHLSKDKVGDGRYVDVNKDGIMDANDKTILGDNQPKFTAGFNNNFSYKNFNLAIQFTGSYGSEVFSIYKRMIAVYHGDRNGMVDVLDRWRSSEDPGNGHIFRATRTPSGWSRDPSSYWVTDGSYLRLRNVTLSYDFDKNLIKNLNMKGLRVYVTGQNLFTITDNPGYDPETSSEGNGLTRGGDYTGYPAARSIIFGVNVTF